MLTRIVAAILILAIGLVLQLIIGEVFGVWMNLTFAALTAAAFFLSFLELLLLALAAVFALNWQPGFSLEIAVLGGLPLILFFLRELLPWQAWLVSLLFIFLGIVVIYAFFGFSIVFTAPTLFLLDLLAAVVFGTGSFLAFAKVSPRL